MSNDNIVMEIKDLKVYFPLDEGLLKAVDGVDIKIKKGRTLGVVGESGCGKSVSNQAIMRLNPSFATLDGEILLYEIDGKRLEEPIDIIKLQANGEEIRKIRGGEIAMIFQEPMKAFSPIHRVGDQISEGILLHITNNRAEARKLGIDMLDSVGIPSPEQRYDEYPHQLSGGMRQRAMIAMALACRPALLIADEPTTALDVTIQAQVLKLMNELKDNFGASLIFITHDLGVIAEMSDDVAVMYLGKIVEYADVDTLFHNPKHPYTKALLDSIPTVTSKERHRLASIRGTVPYPMNLKPGCGFYSRCDYAVDGVCNVEDIDMRIIAGEHTARCCRLDEIDLKEGV